MRTKSNRTSTVGGLGMGAVALALSVGALLGSGCGEGLEPEYESAVAQRSQAETEGELAPAAIHPDCDGALVRELAPASITNQGQRVRLRFSDGSLDNTAPDRLLTDQAAAVLPTAANNQPTYYDTSGYLFGTGGGYYKFGEGAASDSNDLDYMSIQTTAWNNENSTTPLMHGTLAMWVRLDQYMTSDDYWWSRGRASSQYNYARMNSTTLATYLGGEWTAVNVTAPSAGVWKHMLVRIAPAPRNNASGNHACIGIYMDGVLLENKKIDMMSGRNGLGLNDIDEWKFYLGAKSTAAASGAKISIDDFRVFRGMALGDADAGKMTNDTWCDTMGESCNLGAGRCCYGPGPVKPTSILTCMATTRTCPR